MFTFIRHQKEKFLYTTIARVMVFVLSLSLIFAPSAGYAQGINLPVLGTMVPMSTIFEPIMIKGVNIHPNDPLKLDFIIDRGDTDFSDEDFKTQSKKLIEYFMAALTISEKDMWVNLSPYEENRIIPNGFGETTLGRDLLAQDYMLKQFSASLMHPDEGVGEEFWNRVYNKAQEQYGTTEIPMNTFNKIWIIPETAVVYEYEKGAMVVKSHLKVMLEEDYVALEANQNSDEHGLGNMALEDLEIVSGVTSDIVREILIPEIEKEVNSGEIFANLRQIYNAVILASWYKDALKGSFLDQVYVNQGKTAGVDYKDTETNQKIYKQYVESFKVGVYNFIREDYDPSTGKIVPRKYFSGGAIVNPREAAGNRLTFSGVGIGDFSGRGEVVSAALHRTGSSPIDLKQDPIAWVGLGRMGERLAGNLVEDGFKVVAFDPFNREAIGRLGEKGASGARSYEDMMQQLQRSGKRKVIWLMVPDGPIVDDNIKKILKDLNPGDIVIDGGNSDPVVSRQRARQLTRSGVLFLDIGTSGGLEGAEKGASFSVGGDQEAYKIVKPLLISMAAKGGLSFVPYNGMGHMTKMTHNSIEYAAMQAIGEALDLVYTRLRKDDTEEESLNRLQKIVQTWSTDEDVGSYLLELLAVGLSDKEEIHDGMIGRARFKVIGDIIGGGDSGGYAVNESSRLKVPSILRKTAVFERRRAQHAGNFADDLVEYLKEDVDYLRGERVNPFIGRESKNDAKEPSLDNFEDFVEEVRIALANALEQAFEEGISALYETLRQDHDLDQPAIIAHLKNITKGWMVGTIIRSQALKKFNNALKKKKVFP